ncbi:MAG: excinuclease ABC subunit UvrA [Abitibacteriaceae bacterium]|nr:excinuclease ABC subunit UvrA [Abditibacteriaceae bacterium]
MRTTIAVQGAREHNLKNISVEIPRDQLVVVTGVSGSGKSSLAFDTIYAEGQRRYMESLSSFARRFVEQVKKPDVDFMFGLSPVIAIEQKTVGSNPRSTVATLTDIASYLNLLFATLGVTHCPFCQREVPIRSKVQIVEQLMALPPGTAIELRAPIFKIYGEDYNFLFAEVRKKGCRRVIADGEVLDISEDLDLDEGKDYQMEAITDKFIIKPGIEKTLLAGIEHTLALGEQFISVRVLSAPPVADIGKKSRNDQAASVGDDKVKKSKGEKGSVAATITADNSPLSHAMAGCPVGERPGVGAIPFGCPEHHLVMGDLASYHFMFNEPLSACRTCLGLGTYLQVHPDLLVPDKSRSIIGQAFVHEAFRYNRDTWDGAMVYSLAQHYGFSLETPFKDLPPAVVEILLHGTKGEKFKLLAPPGAKNDSKYVGREFRFDGFINRIERHYKRYRQKQVAHSGMEAYLQKVMVEHRCPDCNGARLRPQRLLVTVAGKTIHELGEMNFSELKVFLDKLPLAGRKQAAGQQILKEIVIRVELLLGIGLDYLNFNRKSGTLSGGESQRIRLSTQIGSGLMGMLYVLDEPSIGLHPKDNVKMIQTLQRLRDLGNTVIVVEHDEDTIRAADHVVEIGPGPGIHGGEVVVQGRIEDILKHQASPTGQYLSGMKQIAMPSQRRQAKAQRLTIKGARENNLKNIDVEVPLGQFICVTGASGSGKSTLINDILFKKLYSHFYDSRVLSGEHDSLEGMEHITDVVEIDQTPIGRTPRSNPATYIGFYDNIRQLFAEVAEAKLRGYTPSRFSFNVKGGRCEECAGDGTVTTHLGFMPDVEVLCESCKGARYNSETLEITYGGKNISEILDMPIEEGVSFFHDQPGIARKISVLNQLGLGYLTIGQSATTLSGGEAQRIKLGFELCKLKRGGHILYILDEPTTGLHLADIQRLLECLNRLVDTGHTVLVIEHHLDVIKTADHIIDLGPEGGHNGGEVICCGTPEAIIKNRRSHTGRFLKRHLC